MGIKRMLTSVFGLGFMPIASGTWGSLPVPIIFGLLCWFGAKFIWVSASMVVIAILASWVCIAFADAAIKASGKKDPGEVVADELAGQAITFIGAYAVGGNNIMIAAVVGFLAFRFFDILKPWPCRNLEKLHGGLGILADDLMAGVYAALVLQIVMHFFV